MVSTRRIRCLAAVVAALCFSTLSRAASAQPACAPGVLSDYLGLVGGCTIGGVTFGNFEATFGASNVGVLLSHVDVTPFGAGGQIGFNLVLNQPLTVQAASVSGLGFAERTFEFDFTTSGVGAGAMIGASPFTLFTASVAAAAGGPATGSEALATLRVASQAADDSVWIVTGVHGGGTQQSGCFVADPALRDVTCTPLVTAALADGAVSVLGRVDTWGAVNAPASASLPNLGVAILLGPTPPTMLTPEPARMPLVATGVGLLALVGTRRRRRVAPPHETA